MPDPHDTPIAKLGDLAASAGLRHIHLLAWRDLDDVEAGGSEVHAAWLARLWAEAGIDVTMRTSYAQGQRHEGQRDGYRVVRRGGRFAVFPLAAAQEALGLLGPVDGIVEVWNGVPYFAPLWARVPHVTVVHHVHQQMWAQAMSPGLARVGEWVELKLAPRFYGRSTVVTPTSSSQREIVEHYGLRPEQVRVVPNGIDPQFQPGAEKSPHPLLVTVGRLVPHKRLPDLVDAVAPLRAFHPDLELVIIGDGYERDALRTHLHDRGVDTWVHLVGRVPDDLLVDWYQRAWAVVSASAAEGWGMTITEAAACGTPAVATRIAGHLDTVVDGVTGVLADDPAGLTEPLRRLLTDDVWRAQLGGEARRRAAELTWERTALGVLTALAERAARRRRGRAARRTPVPPRP